jgi:hypothetical protein
MLNNHFNLITYLCQHFRNFSQSPASTYFIMLVFIYEELFRYMGMEERELGLFMNGRFTPVRLPWKIPLERVLAK